MYVLRKTVFFVGGGGWVRVSIIWINWESNTVWNANFGASSTLTLIFYFIQLTSLFLCYRFLWKIKISTKNLTNEMYSTTNIFLQCLPVILKQYCVYKCFDRLIGFLEVGSCWHRETASALPRFSDRAVTLLRHGTREMIQRERLFNKTVERDSDPPLPLVYK